MKYIVLLAALAAPLANADCRMASVADQPQIPDGAVASLEDMQAAREQVADYVERTERYLQCYRPMSHYHDHLVEQMETTAGRFNDQLDLFESRRAALASS